MKSVEFVRRHCIQQLLHLRHVAVEIARHVDVQTSVLKPRVVSDRQGRQLAVWKRQIDQRLDPVEDPGRSLARHGDQFLVSVDRQCVSVVGTVWTVEVAEL